MKVLLPYFVKCKKDNTSLFKEYLKNCVIISSN